MNSRDRSALIIGTAVALAAWLLLRGGPELWGAVARREDRLAALSLRVAVARAEIVVGGRLTDSVASLRARMLGLAPKILPGGTEAEAQEALRARLDELANATTVRVERVDPVADTGRAGLLRRTAARAVVSGDTDGILHLLAGLEHGPMVLTVGAVKVVAQNPASPSMAPEVLRLEVRVAGWYLARERP